MANKIYKVTQQQLKALQEDGSILAGGESYAYDASAVYVLADPFAPEYRLVSNSGDGNAIDLTKDGIQVSHFTGVARTDRSNRFDGPIVFTNSVDFDGSTGLAVGSARLTETNLTALQDAELKVADHLSKKDTTPTSGHTDYWVTSAGVKSYVDSAIGAVKQFKYQIVSTLPAASASTMGTIYLKAHAHDSTSGQPDSYDEYITINNSGTYSWETIGNTDIDLTDYATKASVSSDIAAAINALDVSDSAAANQYVTSVSETNGKISVSRKQVAWSELSGKPSIPTVNNPTITFVQPGTSNQTITLNQSGNKTITFVDKDTNTSHSHASTQTITASGAGGTSGSTTFSVANHMIPYTATLLPTGSNLNDLDALGDTGYYYAQGGNSCKNRPSGVDAFGLIVLRSAFGAYAQILVSSNNNNSKTYVRTNYPAGTWSAWHTWTWDEELKTVAKTGSYNDLTNKPAIPTVNNPTVTITQNGVSKGTFTLNQSGSATIALTDTNTTYTAGTGLTLSGTTFNVNRITESEIDAMFS